MAAASTTSDRDPGQTRLAPFPPPQRPIPPFIPQPPILPSPRNATHLTPVQRRIEKCRTLRIRRHRPTPIPHEPPARQCRIVTRSLNIIVLVVCNEP